MGLHLRCQALNTNSLLLPKHVTIPVHQFTSTQQGFAQQHQVRCPLARQLKHNWTFPLGASSTNVIALGKACILESRWLGCIPAFAQAAPEVYFGDNHQREQLTHICTTQPDFLSSRRKWECTSCNAGDEAVSSTESSVEPLPTLHSTHQLASTQPLTHQAQASTPTQPRFQNVQQTSWLRSLRLPNISALSTWTFMLTYLAFMLILPITALLSKAAAIPWATFIARATEPVAMHAYYVTFTMASCAAVFNCFFGFVLAWALVKYQFPLKKWVDAAVDLPFALPTSVAGLTLATVYSDEGFIGQFLQNVLGVQVVFTKLGVAVAMVFVSFPFVVRTMQPVLQEMEKEMEEAAWSLGASPWRTFVDIVLPPLLPSLLTGTALAFSRALGEFGSIVIISSNFAFKDLIAPVLIFQCLEQYDYVGATVIGTVLLLSSLCIMMCVNWLQSFGQRFKK